MKSSKNSTATPSLRGSRSEPRQSTSLNKNSRSNSKKATAKKATTNSSVNSAKNSRPKKTSVNSRPKTAAKLEKNAMWSGRFENESSELLREFNASLNFDKALYKEDIKGSKAHAKMLCKVGILTKREFQAIERGLTQIQSEIERDEFVFDIKDEDIHMAVEKRLSEIIGAEVGGKLHTARSRNDQVATDLRLYAKTQNLALQDALKDLISVILSLAKSHKKTIMPSFTHLQHAQPISAAFWLLAYGFMFARDIKRLQNSLEMADFSPLGACACAGTSYKTEREFTAAELGFAGLCENAMDAVSDRDFVLDLLYAIAVLFLHTSRLCEELILFSSSEFGFVTMSDAYSTGSSIMPQKKNPDVCELIRGKTGRAYGNLVALLSTMKSLPLAYNKDMQEDKECLFDSVLSALSSVKILAAMMKEMKINEQNMLKACKHGHLLATDLADFLVREKNVPFRKAHFIVGRVVAAAEKQGIDISEIKNLHEIEPLFDSQSTTNSHSATNSGLNARNLSSEKKLLSSENFDFNAEKSSSAKNSSTYENGYGKNLASSKKFNSSENLLSNAENSDSAKSLNFNAENSHLNPQNLNSNAENLGSAENLSLNPQNLLNFENSLNSKQSTGSSSIKSVEKQIQSLEKFLREL